METVLKANLAKLAGIYSAETGVPEKAIGSRALNYSGFFDRLSDDETSITLKTYDRLVTWFSANWPENAGWPVEIERPAPAEAAA